MKALSIRQPWADLIVQGKKTLELRSWTTKYRGVLAIHASQSFNPDECLAYGIDPAHLTTGALIGTVELQEIFALNAEMYASLQREHLATNPFHPPLYGWRVAKSRALPQPIPTRGRMSLFDVADNLFRAVELPLPEAPPKISPVRVGTPRSDERRSTDAHERPFELRVMASESSENGTYSLALFQCLVQQPNAQKFFYTETGRTMQPIAELGSSSLKLVADQVMDALKRSGYRATELNLSRREPFDLNEETGVRLGLLFLAIKRVAKAERVEAIAQGIRRMTSEEVYYWFSKCTKEPTAARAQKALRVLLAEE